MQVDSSVRILLALILVCLVVLVFQGFGGEYADRYKVSVIKSSSPWLMRVDTATGRVDEFRLKGDRVWTTLRETAGDSAQADAAGEEAEGAQPAVAKATPAPPPPARPPVAPAPKAKPVRPGPPVEAAAPGPEALERPPEPITVDAQTEVEALTQALSKSNPPEVRAWAASQLGSFDASRSVPVLVETLKDGDATVVVAAIQALRATGSPEALGAIRGLVDHPDAGVQQAARQAVQAE